MFDSACGSADHLVSRRSMLGNLLAGAAGVGALSQLIHPAVAKQIEGRKKQVLIFLLNGGLSQFESFDPKPKTDTGGPFRAIPTSVPGTHFSELMPFTAKQAHRLAVVRSMFAEKVPGSHGGAREYVVTGRPPQQGPYPWMGPAFSTLLGSNGELPGNIHITPARWGPRADAAFLGPRNASLVLSGGQPPRNIDQPELFNAGQDDVRYRLRTMADQRFSQRRRTAHTEAYQASYDQASRLIRQKSLFDVSRESEQDRQRYGSHDIGRHCLMARRLLERGVRFVQIWSGNDNGFPRRNWDSHEDVKRDHGPLAAGMAVGAAGLIKDLKQRGMLEDTIILWTTEFGRMPCAQRGSGRDHNPFVFTNWLAGGGIRGGVTHGESDEWGYKPLDRDNPTQVYDVHATILHLLGIDHARLTVRHDSLDRRLTDVHGHLIPEILA